MKRSLKLSLVTALAALALGAGTAAADNYDSYRRGPPAPRYVTAKVRTGYVWVQGHYAWDYNYNQWVWTPGHYERARVGYRWVDGNWDNHGGNWRWRAGRWDRDHDHRDHDHDRYRDRDRDRDRDRGRDRDHRDGRRGRDRDRRGWR